MQSNNETPKGFKILSESPLLMIEYHERESFYPIKFFLTIIVFLLMLLVFIGLLWLSIEPLSTLQSRIWEPDFWQFQNGGHLYFDENRFSVAGLVAIIFALLFPVMITHELIWNFFGVSKFMAFPNKLIVKHQLLGITHKYSILSDSLLYFKEQEIIYKQRSKGWTLKAITNQKRFFLFRSEIPILSTKPYQYSHWLGIVLADFYKVELY